MNCHLTESEYLLIALLKVWRPKACVQDIQRRKMAAKKTKPAQNYLGKSKIRSIASIITLLFLGALKAANWQI